MNTPLVSIVIPIRNEEKNLPSCLNAIRRQTYQPLEIIVVDNGSSDNSVNTAKKHGASAVISEKRSGISFAKNTGIQHARGEFVATTDADCEPEPDWIEKLMVCFSDKSVASVGGPNTIPVDSGDFEKCVDYLLRFLSKAAGSKYVSAEQTVAETFHNPGCNAVYRKSVLDEIKGFDESLLTVEDEDLDFRIKQKGYAILYTPHAKVIHKRRANLKSFYHQMYRYAIGRVQFFKKYPRVSQSPRFIPAIYFALNIGMLIGGFFDRILFQYWLISTALFLAGIIVTSSYMSQKLNKKLGLIFLKAVIALFFAWALGVFRGIFYRNPSVGYGH